MDFAIAKSDKYLYLSPPFSIDKKCFLSPLTACLCLSLSHLSLTNQKTVLYLYKEFLKHVNEFI
jgi:hypothetical protein